MSVIVNGKACINHYVTVKDTPYQGIIDLSNSQKKCKTNSNNTLSCTDRKDKNERDTAVDKGNQSDMVTKENVDQLKIDAWRNLRYMVSKPTSIKHKLPLMPPPERGRSSLALIKKICVTNESDKQRKDVFDVESQTDSVYFVTKEDYQLIQYIKDNAVTKEAITNLIYYNDDVNNNMAIQSDLEQESTSHPKAVSVPEGKSGEEEQKFHNFIEHYSEENKAKLSSVFGSTDTKKSDHFTGTNFKNKKHFFEFIYNSMWQLVVCMNRHREMVENKEEKIKSGVDKITQTSLDISRNRKFNSKVTQTANLEEIAMSQLSSGLPILETRDSLDQRMYVAHSNYCNPATTTLRPCGPRALNQQYKRAENQLKKQRIKKPKLNTHKEPTFNSLNNKMQTTATLSPPWQFGNSNQFGEEPTRAASQRLQRYHSDMARPQWFGVIPPPPPPPPPPQYHRQEHRFTNQHTSSVTSQYQGPSQQEEMLEYQKYQQMEMQKKAWESQLQNYPNSAWSYPMQEN